MKKPWAGPAVWSHGHPLLVWLLLVLIVFSGLLAVGRLPIDLSTFNGYPQIRVRVLDPGVPAAVMEDRVTRPMERVLANIPGSVNMVSASSEGLTEIAIFVDGAGNLARVRRQVGMRFEILRSVLPAGVVAPRMEIRDSDHMPVAELVVRSATRTLPQLQAWVEGSFVPQFVDIRGLDRIEVAGGPTRELHIVPDQGRLAALGLALADVVDTLRAYELQADANHRGSFAQDAVQTVGTLPLRLVNGDAIALSEVAGIQEVEGADGGRVYRDAVPALRLLLFKRPGASTLGMVEMFKSRLAWLRTNNLIPSSVQVEWWTNPLLELKRMGRSFLTLSIVSLLLASLLAGMLCRSVRGSLLTLITAVVSLMLVFTFYRLAGLGINPQALGGMMLGYGFILGLPLVVWGMLSSPAAAEDADAQRRAAQRLILAILLLAAAVLVPLLGYGGLPGLIFRDLIIAFTITIAAASLVSIILVPALARSAGPASPVLRPRLHQWVQGLYATPRRVVLVVILVLMMIPAGLYYYRDKQDFLSYTNSAEVLLYIDTPPQKSWEQVASLLGAVELLARNTGHVTGVLTHQAATSDLVSAYSRHPVQLLRIQLSAAIQHQGGAKVWVRNFERALAASSLGEVTLRSLTSSYLAVKRFEDSITRAASGEVYWRVYGPEEPGQEAGTVLAQVGARMVERLQAVPGLRHVRLTAGTERLETVVRLRPEHATEWGLDNIAIGRALRIARGGLVIGDIPNAGHQLRLRVVLPALSPRPGHSLPRLLLRGEIDEGSAVYLDDIADGEELPMPAVRWRDQQRPMIEVRATLAPDVPLREALRSVHTSAEQHGLPPGYQGEFAGFIDSVERATQRALVLLALASILLLGVLLFALRAAGTSLLVGLNVLLAWAGGLCGMVLTGLSWSLLAWLGSIILMVLAAVLTWVAMDDIRLLRRYPAPVATTVLGPNDGTGPRVIGFGLCGFMGLAPLATAWVPGFAWLQPLAVFMVFGLGFSLAGNLLVTPILFRHWEK